ncbi:MAG: archaellar assembly protein FlaJ [Methanophagales archaeon]|nr:archaellar assembly protein FlaJ [Methanophagales archaeon]
MKLKMDIGSQIKEDQAMDLDLLDTLTYMSSIATSGISREKLFELASQQEGIIPKYLEKILLLVQNYGYTYSKACKTVAVEASNPVLNEFLTRFSNALATGEEEEKFLRGEVERTIEVYTNRYIRDVDTLSKWTDAYSALLVSVTMVIAVFLISSMLFKMGDMYLMSLLSGTLLCFVAFLGVYIIYRVSPYEKIVHSLKIKSREQEIAKRLCMFILPAVGIASFILLITGAEPWIIFLIISASFAPIGVIAIIDEKRIEKADGYISPFLKSLGSIAGTTGTTLTFALGHLDKKSVGSLEKSVNRLYKRLINGMDPRICWSNFIGESGSELINKSTRVFQDAIELGGDPTRIGEIVSKSSLGIVLLRAKRKLVSRGFVNLIIPLHVTMCGILMFIYQIMVLFNNAVAEMMEEHSSEVGGAAARMSPGVSFFNFGTYIDLAFVAKYLTIVVLILTVANVVASKFASGGSNYKLCFYASFLFFLSAVLLFMVPILADKMFTMQL